jgi:hypothetical protein
MKIETDYKVIQEAVPAVPAIPQITEEQYVLTLSKEELLHLFCSTGITTSKDIYAAAERCNCEAVFRTKLTDLGMQLYSRLKEVVLDFE